MGYLAKSTLNVYANGPGQMTSAFKDYRELNGTNYKISVEIQKQQPTEQLANIGFQNKHKLCVHRVSESWKTS